MADAKSREQQQQEWWDRWWGEDFSWAGLAAKSVGRSIIGSGLNGKRTLQDYWRCDPASGVVRDDAAMLAAGELAECEGALFHIAHLPAKSKAGAATWKADLNHENWARLEQKLGARLAAGAETKVDVVGDAEGPDGRTQLGGCVLRGIPSQPRGSESPLHLEARRMAVLGVADYRGHHFGPGARFDRASFSGDASFIGASFSGYASFDSASFSGEASFNIASFSGYASFDGASFSGDARFVSASFSGGCFVSASFSRDASFNIASFSGDACFDRASFSGDARFDSASFNGEARFERASFSGDASFVGANFSGNAIFDSASFTGVARFLDAKFKGKAYFQVKAFEKAATFQRCLFDELVWFDGANFKGDMDFTAAVFDKLASFEKITWPQDCRHWHSAFDDVLFRSKLQLTGAGFRAFAAFDGATLERGVQLDDPETEEEANRSFRAERKAASASAKRDGADFENLENEVRKERDKDKANPVKQSEINSHIRAQREERLRQLERGCRVLKLAMDYSSNKTREQMLYRFELQARRAQRKLRFGEKTFSDLYAAASDYGASIWRPFAALAVLIAAFGGGFWGLAAALDPLFDARLLAGDLAAQLWATLDFSWGNVFKPLSALSEDAASVRDGSMIDLLLTETGDGWPLVVRMIATLQSLLAIVLAFLFALAVRRRFQIS